MKGLRERSKLKIEHIWIQFFRKENLIAMISNVHRNSHAQMQLWHCDPLLLESVGMFEQNEIEPRFVSPQSIVLFEFCLVCS